MKCDFCDPSTDRGKTVPACKRPATKQIRGKAFGRPTIYSTCDVHFVAEEIDGELYPIPESKLMPVDDVESYIARRAEVVISCEGCGDDLIRLGGNFALPEIDHLVLKGHLDRCVWRRKKTP